uniref:Putative ribbon-helix-helix protein repressor n=1 Tax=viral metagenome TaxID=1070528 RepID=A0A6M3IDZ3_9ZZZZ
MGRKKKYGKKTEIITLSINPQVLEVLDKTAEESKISRSELITRILAHTAKSKKDYARAMAKYHNAEFHYWKYQLDVWKDEM